jgi:hypothetical protein
MRPQFQQFFHDVSGSGPGREPHNYPVSLVLFYSDNTDGIGHEKSYKYMAVGSSAISHARKSAASTPARLFSGSPTGFLAR